MVHRHLNSPQLTLAAVDDLISRGNRLDWEGLRSAVLESRELIAKVRQVCLANLDGPSSGRYHFWLRYVQDR